MQEYRDTRSKGIKTIIATSTWEWPKNLFINIFGLYQPTPENLETTVLKAMDASLDKDEKEVMLYFYRDKIDRYAVAAKTSISPNKVSVIRSICLRKLYHNRFSRYILTRGVDQAERILQGPVTEWDISFLHMPMRFYNSIDISKRLIGADKNIETVGDLIQFTRKDIMKARSMGEATVNLLEEKLTELGLSLKKEE